MSVGLLLRLLSTSVVAIVGWGIGVMSLDWIPLSRFPMGRGSYLFIITFAGALLGFWFAPYLTVIPYRSLREKLRQVPARALMMGILGTIIGLLVAALLALPLSLLPGGLGHILPFVIAIFLGGLGAATLALRERDILATLGISAPHERAEGGCNLILMDTSVIIDGRVADVCQSGFISADMVVPRFVLDELQHIADSPDMLRRNRGRRGLEILSRLQKDKRVSLEISDMDPIEAREVDGKLIRLALELHCPILTNDYNLNRVADLQGVRVLNINELANAVKVMVLPGETLDVDIIQEGKEAGQGVGYLDDGTMIVVEDGRRHMNDRVEIVVTRVLQTVAGRMIFGQSQDTRH